MIVNTRHANYSGEVWIVEWVSYKYGWKREIKSKRFTLGFEYASGFHAGMVKRGIEVISIYREDKYVA